MLEPKKNKKKKDKWGRSSDSKWYGFNPDTKKWTLDKPQKNKVKGGPKPIGYYRDELPKKQPSDRLGNNSFYTVPPKEQVEQTKKDIKKVGKTTEAVKKRKPGISHEKAKKEAKQIVQANKKPQTTAREHNPTQAQKDRDAYIFDEGTHGREYMRMPLQFLAGDMPTEEERIQERIRYTDPNTSASDKFMGTLGQAAELVPSATLNTAAGLAFSPANYGKFAKVVDAVSPVGLPTNSKNIKKTISSVDDVSKNLDYNFNNSFLADQDKEAVSELKNIFKKYKEDFLSLLKKEKDYNKTVESANNWSKKWFNNPQTAKKINEYEEKYNKAIDITLKQKIRNGEKIDFSSFKNPFTSLKNNIESGNFNSKIGKPDSYGSENTLGASGYDLNKGVAERQNLVIIENIKNYVNTKFKNLSKKERQNKINELVEYVAIHEGNHGLTDGNRFLPKSVQKDIVKIFGKDTLVPTRNPTTNNFNKFEDYLQNPTEVYARIMETRKFFNIKPKDVITPKQAFEIRKKIASGETPISKEFGQLIKDPKQLAKVMNYLPSLVPAAIATGAALNANSQENTKNTFKYGSSLNQVPENIPTWNYPSSGIPIYETNSAPRIANTFGKGGPEKKEIINPSYYKKLARIESSNNPKAKAPTSSAAGLYQFTKNTWKGIVNELGLNYTLEDRFDPVKSRIVVEAFTKKNAAHLKNKLNRNPTENELYLAHFLGAGGSDKLLAAYEKNPNADVSTIMPSKVINANKKIFTNKNGSYKTVSDIYNWSSEKMGTEEANVNIPVNPSISAPTIAIKPDVDKITKALKEWETKENVTPDNELYPQHSTAKVKKKKNPKSLNDLYLTPPKQVSFGGLPKLDF